MRERPHAGDSNNNRPRSWRAGANRTTHAKRAACATYFRAIKMIYFTHLAAKDNGKKTLLNGVSKCFICCARPLPSPLLPPSQSNSAMWAGHVCTLLSKDKLRKAKPWKQAPSATYRKKCFFFNTPALPAVGGFIYIYLQYVVCGRTLYVCKFLRDRCAVPAICSGSGALGRSIHVHTWYSSTT